MFYKYERFVTLVKLYSMKKLNFLLSSLLLCICCTIQAKNKVIEQPPFVVSSTTSIEVSQVEISDTATVLHIFANTGLKTG